MTGQTPGSAVKGQKRVFTTALTETATYDKEGLGTIRQEGNNFYKWVQSDNGTANLSPAAGDVVGYIASTGYAANKVTADTSDTSGIGAGVTMAAIADQEYGWIQIKGQATVSTAFSVTAGNGLKFSADRTLAAVAAHTDVMVAYAVDTTVTIICDFPF